MAEPEQPTSDIIRLQNKIDHLESEIKSLSGVIEETVSKAIDPNALKALRYLIYRMVCDSIKELIARGTALSLSKVESILTEWGLDLSNQEAGKRIESCIPPWKEDKHAIVPLKNIEYRASSIVVSLNGESVSIVAGVLPFATSAVLDDIKDIFEGDLEVFIEKRLAFQWKFDRLSIEEKYKLKQDISIDRSVLQLFERTTEIADKLGPFKTKDYFKQLIGASKTEATKDKAKILSDFKQRPIAPDYNPDCIDVLTDMADVCYITNEDFWFRIGDVLVWEEPKHSKATYIFKWPEQPLQSFIFRVRISTLIDIREDPDSGYKDRVIHDEKISNWERNLKNKI